ncbi:MBL fold metallo-hydrolase [Leptotrichia sp. oral taxon 218]|jgi:beta-lactamase domain protein|uniref:MBL fold metallo-hydrolase n=1 Tax=Leptotrichia sp. oral taxon 218 TaxID=712361 RepID=UPI001B8BD14C|nr:MBL fold metallo-hydrolase [Leptotrichia sp. oral taxon 218]QUB95949.1 MBL fold metallo-hydrolase [Leptotrichia sp. oral taxon 218]
MEIIRFVNDNLARSNCYVVKCEKKCFVVDPGEEKMTKVIDFLEKNELEMEAVLLTHGHWDHILGINSMMEYKKVPLFVSENGYEFLFNPELSLCIWQNLEFKVDENLDIRKLKENDVIGFDGIIVDKNEKYEKNKKNKSESIFKIIETPGHSSGDICFYSEKEKIMITGDTLFKGTYGRVDLPTSNPIEMGKSLKKLMQYPEDTKVYPGHSFDTTIGEEKRYY